MDPSRLTAAEAARRIRSGDIASETLVRDCLDRIEARDEVVQAWVHLDREKALAEARARDAVAPRGPLHGVPVAVKDIIDVAGMPTACGSPIYSGWVPATDAACVAMARRAGAVVLGKTVTTEFAAMTPGNTVNPHDPARSPGGSSSGSAAAVADFMAPLAFGTQTIGSTIRPASYCGVVGFKPSYGTFSLAGVKPQAHSMDTLGLMARSAGDIAMLADALWGAPGAFAAPAPDRPPRVGLCRSPQWDEARPETVAAMEAAASELRAAGAVVTDVDLPDEFGRVLDAQWTILKFESSQSLAFERIEHASLLSEALRSFLEDGAACPAEDYRAALALAASCRAAIAAVVRDHDVLLTPSAAGEALPMGAPPDLLFQRLWTVLHLPCITLPAFTGPNGLPVGIQLVGTFRGDAALLAWARWAEERLGTFPTVA